MKSIDQIKFETIAEKLWLKIYGLPKSHRDWVNGFNIRGEIIELIKKEI